MIVLKQDIMNVLILYKEYAPRILTAPPPSGGGTKVFFGIAFVFFIISGISSVWKSRVLDDETS